MADLSHAFGTDLVVGPSGDLTTVDQDAETQQRILRRLLTSSGSYIWQIAYGAGLPSLVGSVVSAQQVNAIVRAQIALEATVAATPEPTVTLTAQGIGRIAASINYYSSSSASTQVLTFTMG